MRDGWLCRQRREKAPDLGPREIGILEQLWTAGPLSAQEIRAGLDRESVTLSTIQSTLERLHRKQLVHRVKSGRAFHYSAAVARSTLISRLLGELAREIGGGSMAPMVSGFVEFAAGRDPAVEARVLRALGSTEAGDD